MFCLRKQFEGYYKDLNQGSYSIFESYLGGRMKKENAFPFI